MMKNMTTTTAMTGRNFEGLEATAIGCKEPRPVPPPPARDVARFSNILSEPPRSSSSNEKVLCTLLLSFKRGKDCFEKNVF
jgi:hypothetical protein